MAAILGFAAAPLPAEETPKKRCLITISKETTYITEPLRPDGYVDYVAALNRECSKGVTTENNAAVPFWRAMGPELIDEEIREKYFKLLGIPPLPEKGDYCVSLNEFLRLLQEQPRQWDKLAGDLDEDAISDQQDEAMKRPWSKKEFPVPAAWLEANEKPLALIVEATGRPRCYMPLVANPEHDTVIAVLLPGVQEARQAARLLMCRAMLQLGQGKIDKAWADVLACHRLARLVGEGPTIVDALVSTAIESIACQGDVALAHCGKLTAKQAKRFEADLRSLPPMPKMADKVHTERYMYLDAVAFVAREGLSALTPLTGGGSSTEVIEKLTKGAGDVLVDWDVVLKMGNPWYDRLIEAMGKPDRAEWKKALAKMDDDLMKLMDDLSDYKSLVLSLIFAKSPRVVISRWMGNTMISLFLPAIAAGRDVEDRGRMIVDLSRIALALAAYHADHGAYPENLARLAPKYIAEIPDDLFSDKPLRYKLRGKGYLLYSLGRNGVDDGGRGYDDCKDGADWEDWDDLVVRTPVDNGKEK